MLRGSADHKSFEFQARSAFMFSSTLSPPLASQDLSRMAILSLNPLAHGPKIKLNAAEWRTAGREIMAALQAAWPRVDRTIAAYHAALMRQGHSSRGADQFGTLLALADCALYADGPELETCETWAGMLPARELNELADDVANHERCLKHLGQAQLDAYKGGSKRTVARWVALAKGVGENRASAEEILQTFGMRVVQSPAPRKFPELAGRWFVAVANSHRNLATLFERSVWATRADTTGVWKQALARVPGAVEGYVCRLSGGNAERTVLIPLELLADDLDFGEVDQ